jgi:hypothetical protein
MNWSYVSAAALSLSVSARILEPKAGSNDYEKVPEFQAILTQLKTHGGFTNKTPPTPQTLKTPTRGQQIVEEAKARNRAILVKKQAQDKAAAESALTEDGPEQWKEQTREAHASWRKEIHDQRLIWQREQDIFLGRLKVYQENSVPLPVKAEKIIEKKLTEPVPEVTVVNGAFDMPIRDQLARPTCAAFAGARALEILLAQHDLQRDLSEQYLYWASKPDCRELPCQHKGSWIAEGYRHSMAQKGPDIPSENECAYSTEGNPLNETLVPLSPSCGQGAVQVGAYSSVRTLAEVVDQLKKNIPVVLGAKLTENFYINQGLVLLADSTKKLGAVLDAHNTGHAFLAIGVLELPVKLRATEGSYCILVANSWGKGWGAGGYACVTENWLVKFRVPSPFLAANMLKTNL